MAVKDMELTREVRAVLARNWVKTEYLDYSVIGGTVYIRGIFEVGGGERRSESPFADIANAIRLVEDDIKRLRDVNGTIWNIDNWEKRGSGWFCLKTGKFF